MGKGGRSGSKWFELGGQLEAVTIAAPRAYLADDREGIIDRAVQEGYRRAPQGGELDRDQ